MDLKTATDWLTWGALVLPLFALAWAAVQYVLTQKREQKHREYERFFDIMRKFGASDSTVPGNMAAAFELRQFPQYGDVIIRLCEEAPMVGGTAAMLNGEMARTAEFLRKAPKG